MFLIIGGKKKSLASFLNTCQAPFLYQGESRGQGESLPQEIVPGWDLALMLVHLFIVIVADFHGWL